MAISQARAEANDHKGGPSSRHLKPIVHAEEMVFASAAALSAAFGRKVLALLTMSHLQLSSTAEGW